MTSQAPDMLAVLKRLERLERQNRRLKRGGALALIAVTAIVLMGQAATKNRIIEAQAFVVRDLEGRVRAKLHVDSAGVALELFDTSETSRAAMMLSPLSESPTIVLADSSMKASLALSVMTDGPKIEVTDAKGLKSVLGASGLETVGKDGLVGQAVPKTRTLEAERFVLRDPAGRVRASLSISKDPSPFFPEEVGASPGPAVELFDSDGKLSARLQERGLTFSERGIEQVSLHGLRHTWVLRFLTAGFGAPLILAASERPSILLQDGEGSHANLEVNRLQMSNKDGKVIWRAP